MPFDDLEFSGLCDRCEKHPGMVETCTGDIICRECHENDQQDAYDRQQENDFAAHHGSDHPQSDAEREDMQGRRSR